MTDSNGPEANGAGPRAQWLKAALVLGAYSVFLTIVWLLAGSWIVERWTAGCLTGAQRFACQTVLGLQALEVPKPSDPFKSGSIGAGRFPQTSLRLLEEGDFAALECRDLGVMRNEIFARRGHIFMTQQWRSYFGAQPWYKPSVANAEPLLIPVEKENIARIMKREADQSCR